MPQYDKRILPAQPVLNEPLATKPFSDGNCTIKHSREISSKMREIDAGERDPHKMPICQSPLESCRDVMRLEASGSCR
jgi:hypothetical protein